MLSWVFRHRAQLGRIYGIPPAEAPVALPAAPPVPRLAAGEDGAARPLAPGGWARRRRYVVLRPMQPDAG